MNDGLDHSCSGLQIFIGDRGMGALAIRIPVLQTPRMILIIQIIHEIVQQMCLGKTVNQNITSTTMTCELLSSWKLESNTD